MRLRTLDAARVVAEYVVVSYHLEGYWVNSAFLSSHGLSIDLMSFFFVLSGFAVAHSYAGNGRPGLAYLKRRLSKAFPLYLAMWVLGLPQCVVAQYVQKSNPCATHFWVHLLSQPLGLQWVFGWEVGGSNPPAWYLATLVWLWAVYCAADWNAILGARPLTWLWVLYVLSLCLCMVFMQVPTDALKQLPVIRLCEFLMGCCSALAVEHGHLVHWTWALFAFAVYVSYVVVTMLFPEVWPERHTKGHVCSFWQAQSEYRFTAGNLVTCTSMLWAIVVQYLAGTELSELEAQTLSGKEARWNAVMWVLRFDFFQSLSAFSLELYLSHYVLKALLMWAMEKANALQLFPKDFYVLLVYAAAYAWHARVQPLFLWAVEG